VDVPARETLVVPAVTDWSRFPGEWGGLLDEVWACLRAAGVTSGCRNVMLYLDDRPSVEVGVLAAQPCEPIGRVVRSALPAGQVVRAVHWGGYAGLGAAHDAIHEWAGEQGIALSRTRWEVYGPHHDDPSQVWTEVSWLRT